MNTILTYGCIKCFAPLKRNEYCPKHPTQRAQVLSETIKMRQPRDPDTKTF